LDIKLSKLKVLFCICSCLLCLYASVISYADALAGYDRENLKIPEPEVDGRTQTLNKKGGVTAKFDYATLAFLEFSAGKVALEVGGAFGKVMLAALKRSKTTQYTLSDLEARHLYIAAKILQGKINENKLPPNSVDRVKFVQADITNAQSLKNFGTYEAILVGRVLNYLSPNQLEITVKHLFLLLKPGGRIFIVAGTPYVNRYKKFIPEYEQRIKDKKENPGFVNSLLEYVNTEVTTPDQIKNISKDPFFFLDDKVLREVFERNGFKVIECKMMPLCYKSKSWGLDGRENVILIAEKE
jgi:SAM-dependent methyltransferase